MTRFLLMRYVFIGLSCLLSVGVWGQEALEKAKAEAVIGQVANRYRPPGFDIGDPEKYYWPKAMARFEQYGHSDSLANAWVEQLHDRSPFHFTLVGMARLMGRYPEAPAIQRWRTVLITKIFERTDAHNAWTSEGTENHVNMARTSGYLAAQEALSDPVNFPDAPQRLAFLKEWAVQWSQRAVRSGTGEWQSSTYGAYNAIGWLNLFDFAKDPEVREAARAVLDLLAAEIAVQYAFGSLGGAEMRGSGLDGAPTSATNYLAWWWFDPRPVPPMGFEGSQYIQLLHALTSGYRPPQALLPIARKEAPEAWCTGWRPSYLYEHPRFVRTAFFTTPRFSLGSCTNRYGGWTGSTYQILQWKLLIANGEALPFEIGGNGRYYDDWSGKTRDPFTQISQYRNVLFQLTRTPPEVRPIGDTVRQIVAEWGQAWQRDFQRRFPNDDKPQVVTLGSQMVAETGSYLAFPAAAQLQQVAFKKGSVWWARLGEVYVLAWPINPRGTLLKKGEGKSANRQWLINQAEAGELCGFVVEVLETKQFASQDAFLKELHSKRIDRKRLANASIGYRSLSGWQLAVAHGSDGAHEEAISDWGYGTTQRMVLPTSPPLQQPQWPSGKWHGRVPIGLKVNGQLIDPEQDSAVIRGVGVLIEQGKFELNGQILWEY